ncbi:unnamed protein product [Phytophthora fragariaefolia]|uniref:Unnamed protein product n=1 Tax=Phytophthora fragariaefolia TaxID=1490495 RepID=A0A9W6YBB6_9STRA|nr:unnamed protein product [Phytophthora fragariaefolia]
MDYLGDAITESVVDTDFDVNLLSEFLFQADGMPMLPQQTDFQASGAGATGSTDSMSSGSPGSPEFIPPSQLTDRNKTMDPLCTDSKAELAVQILLRETEGTDFSRPPSITTRTVPTPNPQQQVMTAVATYAFEFLDLKCVFISACNAILGCGTEWPGYTAVSLVGEVVDKPQGNIRYAKTNTCYQSTAAAEGDRSTDVSVESRSLMFYRMSDTYGILVWDFADEDDLHPLNPETIVKRDIAGAYVQAVHYFTCLRPANLLCTYRAMVRREICRDGAERVAYRCICTKRHSFPPVATAPALSHFLDLAEEGGRICGSTVLDRIRERASQASMVSV